MTRAYLIKKRGKEYIVFTCDYCNRENVYGVDKFLMAYVVGKAMHCKHCGADNYKGMFLDRKVELKVDNYKRKLMRRYGKWKKKKVSS